jgi:ComF family protein
MRTSTLLDTLLTLLFPDRCAACKRFGALLCTRCQARFVPYPTPSCPTLNMATVHVAFLFQSPLREAIHHLKYRRVRRMARPLGAALAANIAPSLDAVDAVLAIPLHPTRLAERGFNQAGELAREVASVLQLCYLNDGLVRLRATEQQAKLNARSRAENMRDAFGWKGDMPPRRVLLVDDVFTTGATMEACAAALRQAGTEVIHGLALARSRLD